MYSDSGDFGAPPSAIVVVGPTAVGKTEYAIEIAARYGGEIVSADSMQIYKGLDIGTAKPTAEELARVPHHMIGCVDPTQDYSVAAYRADAAAVICEICARGRLPVICGGTGLYVNALLYKMDFSGAGRNDALRERYETLADTYGNEHIYDILKAKDPEGAARIHPNNRKRVIRALERMESGQETQLRGFEQSFVQGDLVRPVMLLLTRPRDELRQRIDTRADNLLAAGLEQEVRELAAGGLSRAQIAMLGIGYKEMLDYIDGMYDLAQAAELIRNHSRRYARKQMTWFRRYKDAKVIELREDIPKEQSLCEIFDYLDACFGGE